MGLKKKVATEREIKILINYPNEHIKICKPHFPQQYWHFSPVLYKNLKNFLWITFFFYDCPLLGNIWAWFEKCHWVTLYRECGAGLDSQSRIHKQENATKELLAAAEALNSLFIYCLALCLSKLSYISFAVEPWTQWWIRIQIVAFLC